MDSRLKVPSAFCVCVCISLNVLNNEGDKLPSLSYNVFFGKDGHDT